MKWILCMNFTNKIISLLFENILGDGPDYIFFKIVGPKYLLPRELALTIHRTRIYEIRVLNTLEQQACTSQNDKMKNPVADAYACSRYAS